VVSLHICYSHQGRYSVVHTLAKCISTENKICWTSPGSHSLFQSGFFLLVPNEHDPGLQRVFPPPCTVYLWSICTQPTGLLTPSHTTLVPLVQVCTNTSPECTFTRPPNSHSPVIEYSSLCPHWLCSQIPLQVS
jgi:hypothetical protein